MNIRNFLYFALISLAVVSCGVNGESNTTPQITISTPTLNSAAKTLAIYATSTNGEYVLDTVHVGDTVSFKVSAAGYGNSLTLFKLTNSVADSIASVLLPATKAELDAKFVSGTSNYAAGIFYLNQEIEILIFPFKYIVKKASKDAKLTFFIQNNAVFNDPMASNSNYFSLKIPIAAKK